METDKQGMHTGDREAHPASWYAKSAYESFIKNADPETSDADPVAAIQRVFEKRATDELKDTVKAEGKTAEGAYQFLWAVARLCKQTDGGCHIGPETGDAIAMHYFQDVPSAVIGEYEPSMKEAKLKREYEKRETASRSSSSGPSKNNGKVTPKGKNKTKPNTKKNADAIPEEVLDDKATHETTSVTESPDVDNSAPSSQTSGQMSFLDGLFA